MVSTEAAKLKIIENAKYPEESVVLRYRRARRIVCDYLVDPLKSATHITNAEAYFRQRVNDLKLTCWQHNDAEQSIEIVHAIQGMRNELARYDFVRTPCNASRILPLAGVSVSVRLDLLVHRYSKGKDQIGAAVLKMNKYGPTTRHSAERREDAGTYAAALVWLYVSRKLQTERTPNNKLCMSIDVRYGKAFIAPRQNSQRISNLEAACKGIAALWDEV